jgi:hypothetical protein
MQLRQNSTYQIPGCDLKVFCVSNTYYWKHRYSTADQTPEYLHLTNILGLRAHCISLVAQSQLRAAKEYIIDKVPSLLGSVELWIQSGAGDIGVERRQAIRSIVEEIELQFQRVSSTRSFRFRVELIRKFDS